MLLRFFTLLSALLSISLLFVSVSAADKPTLTVYTYDSFTSEWGPGPAIEKAFEGECDCDLQFVGLESSLAALSRLQLEGDNTAADIILGLDISSQGLAEATGLLQPHGIAAERLGGLTVPLAWSDDTFLPFDYGYFAFVYDKRKITNPPTSLRELVENKDNLNIVYSDPRFSTPGLGLLLWVKHVYGDDAPEAWAELAQSTVAVPPSWSSAYSLFLQGEADMVLSYTTSPAYHIIAEEDENYGAAIFSEGHYMQIEIAAMTKNANRPLAQQFLQFMIGDGFQQFIPTGNWMYPVNGSGIPPAFGDVPKPLLLSPDAIEARRQKWLNEWQNSIAR